MEKKHIVQDAQILLAQMSEEPEEIIAALKPNEHQVLINRLKKLKEYAATVQNENDLLSLANGIFILVENIPGLRALLLPKEFNVKKERAARKILKSDLHATEAGNKEAAEKYAPRITNDLADCHDKLDQRLQRLNPPARPKLRLLDRLRSKKQRKSR